MVVWEMEEYDQGRRIGGSGSNDDRVSDVARLLCLERVQ